MQSAHRTGRICEDLAAASLTRNGWTLLHRNFRDGPREIDIIVRRDAIVAFVEVKGRASADHHHPLESIGPLKRRDLARAARSWIRRHGRAGEIYRFDAIAVLAPSSERPSIDHVEDAWRM